MTSPAQLKYLEAMGIPVWVSRELIVEDKSASEVPVNKEKSTEQVSTAESLIETLENPTQVPAQVTPPKKATAQTTSELPPQIHSKKNSEHTQNEIGRTKLHTLFALGDLDADWMVIGQSPDINDSAMYQPYPHESGELLNNMLRAVGIEQPRKQSFWINILKSPKSVENTEELAATIELNKLLTERIKQVQPKIVLLVGQLAAQNLLQSKEPLARLRLFQKQQHFGLEGLAKEPSSSIPVIVTYYPSYLLSKPQDKAKTWNDLKLAMSLLSDNQ